MRTELELYEQIDRYLAQQMSQQELVAFEALMASDANLRSMVEISAITNELIVESGLKNERSVLQQLEAEYSVNTVRWHQYATIVASGLLLVASSIFLGHKKTTQENAKQSTTLIVSSLDKTNSTFSNSTQEKNTKVQHSAASMMENNSDTKSEETQVAEDVTSASSNLSPEAVKEELNVVKAEPTKVSSIDCEVPFKSVKISTEASCQYKSTGAIKIKGVQDDWKLYLNDERVDELSSLSSGKYVVKLVTNEGCSNAYSVEVKSKACYETKQVHWSLNQPEEWKLEFEKENGKIQIMDRSGKMITQENVSGNSFTVGSELIQNTGLYSYQISYPDGQIEQGFIQIVP